jgi:hypothetical protein
VSRILNANQVIAQILLFSAVLRVLPRMPEHLAVLLTPLLSMKRFVL